MIQSYDQIKNQANLINNEVEDNVYIQKIYSSSYFLCLTIRFIGRTKFIYIGRGNSYEGLWFSENRVESFLRKRDKFLEYLRKHLSSTSFSSITVDKKDRIFSLDYFKWGRVNKMFFFYNARNLFFANHYYDDKSGEMKCFKSWTMKTELAETIDFSIFDEVGRKELDSKLNEKEILSINALLISEKQNAMKGNFGGKSKKFFNRKRGKILKDLENVKSIDDLKTLAESNFELDKLEMKIPVGSIKLKFKTKDHYKRRDEVYTKIKKLNKAKEILTLRLADTQESLDNYIDQTANNNLKTIAPIWRTQSNISVVKVSPDKSYKVYTFESFSFGIGLSANGNDQLRNEWANKSDLWFHLEGDKSPHIIVKLNDLTLSQSILTIVASAMIEFSKETYSEANLIYTQVKNLKGVKGAPGKVLVKKEKRIRINVDNNWKDSIL